MFGFSRSLASALTKTYRVKVCGVVFRIRKVNPLDYMAGAQVLQKQFDVYKTKGQKQAETTMTDGRIKAVKEHYKDIFMAGVVSPALTRKEGTEGILVDNLFSDWDLAEGLYRKIMELTYGKKKFRSMLSHRPKP